VHSVSQRPNLRHLGEPLAGAEGLLKAVSFKKTTEGVGRGSQEESRMPDGSEFHTAGAAILKLREAKVVPTLEERTAG